MSDDEPSIRLAAGSQSVAITLHEPYGSMSDELKAMVNARSRAFSGEVATTIWTHELRALLDLLIDLDRKVGQLERKGWHSMEGELALTFESSALGHVRVQVELSDGWYADEETILRFFINADQTYLPMWIQQVTHALKSLPTQPSSGGM